MRFLPAALLVLGTLAVVLAGCNTIPERRSVALEPYPDSQPDDPAAQAAAARFEGTAPPYVIMPGDDVEIKFAYRPEYDFGTRVLPDGHVSLPFIGRFRAAQKTTDQLEREIAAAYRRLAGDEPDAPAGGDKQYRINPSDLLEIKFAYQQQFNESVRVRPDGKISLLFVNDVEAEGKTPNELQSELTHRYNGFIKDPVLVVIVRETASKRYYQDGTLVRPGVKDLDRLVVLIANPKPQQYFVGGEVSRPGFFPYHGPMTALQAILGAGGELKSAALDRVAVLRRGPDNRGIIMVRNLKMTFDPDDAGEVRTAFMDDVNLQPGDVVIVPKTSIASVTDYVNAYVYNLLPSLRNTPAFYFLYDLNPEKLVTSPQGG